MKCAYISPLITEEALTSADVDIYIVDEIVDKIALARYKKRKQFGICRSSSSLLYLEIAK